MRVSEDLLLLDLRTGENPGGHRVSIETSWCTGLTELRAAVLAARRRAAGIPLMPIGAAPVGEGVPALAGLRLEIAVPDRHLAVQVSRRLKPWLPVVGALTANSPFAHGLDTGYASWGFVQRQRRALGMLAPRVRSWSEPLRTAEDLQHRAATVSRALLDWHARPHPTRAAVQVRAGDVCLNPDDTVLVAGLVGAAVVTATRYLRAGRPGPLFSEDLVQTAHWQAARHGLTGTLMDPRLSRPRPAWHLVDELFGTVTPGIGGGPDLDLVLEGLARLRGCGTGADRQRLCYRNAGGIVPGLTALAGETSAGAQAAALLPSA